MMWWSQDAGPAFWLTMLIGMVLFAAIIVAIVWAIMRLVGKASAARPDESASILRERFARGEINQTEFEEAKRILGLR
jgi:uncharacterized membrane protein